MLIHAGRASVVAIHFEDKNSRLLQLASRLAMGLRPSLPFGEALAPITDRKLPTDYLRQRIYALSARGEVSGD